MEAASKTLPKIGDEFEGGKFAGVLTNKAGELYALVLMADRPASYLSWKDAMAWASGVGGDLPNRVESAHLFAVLRSEFKPDWHWTNEEHEKDASYAWDCYFDGGSQYSTRKDYEGSAVAVRRFPLRSFNPFHAAAKRAVASHAALREAAEQILSACDATHECIQDIKASA